MKAKIVSILVLGFMSYSLAQSAELEQVVPIKDVWSIFSIGDKVVLRFKGSEDNSQVLQYSNLGRAEIRELKTWEVVRTFENVRWVTLSPDAKVAGVLYGNEIVQIVELESNRVIKELNNVDSIMFSPKGQYVKVVMQNSTQIIETENWQIKYEFKTSESPNLTFALDEDHFGIVGDDGKLKIVSTGNGQVIKEFIGDCKDHGLHFSPDGKYVTVVYKDDTSALIEMGSWQVIKEFDNSKSLGFIWNGTCLYRKMIDDTVEIIDFKDFHIKFSLLKVLFFDATEGSKYIWAINKDNTAVQVVELETGKIMLEGINNAEECCFAQDDRVIVALQDAVRVYKLPRD